MEDQGQNTEGQSTGGASRRDGALFASLRIGCRCGDRPYTLTAARIGCHSSCRFRVFADLVCHATIQYKHFLLLLFFFLSLFFNSSVRSIHILFFMHTDLLHSFNKIDSRNCNDLSISRDVYIYQGIWWLITSVMNISSSTYSIIEYHTLPIRCHVTRRVWIGACKRAYTQSIVRGGRIKKRSRERYVSA